MTEQRKKKDSFYQLDSQLQTANYLTERDASPD